MRAIKPVIGIDTMIKRRKREKDLTAGPGSLSQALGINLSHNKLSLVGDKIWIEEGEKPAEILATPRIGVEYAKEDALLPYRFVNISGSI
jgi:DNA-3-methyladenine glycosylase